MRESGERGAKRATVAPRMAASRALRALGAVRARGAVSAVLALTGVVLALGWPAGAPGLRARGHAFAFAFGDGGTGAGEFLKPSGMAVSEANGDVYVVDQASDRIDRFGPEGKFIAAWGWGVSNGAKEYEICEASCQPGTPGNARGQLNSPGTIAVDNSTSANDPSRGDVYVVADARSEHGHLEKFSPEGKPLGSVREDGIEAWEGALDGVAVDGAGRLWVYRGVEASGQVERFSDAVKNAFEEPARESSVPCPKPGFAVDASGEHVFVDHESTRQEACPAEEGEQARPVVAARLGVAGELLETKLDALDPLQTAAVATAPASGEVFLAHAASLASFDKEGGLIQSVALPGTSPQGSALAVNGASGAVYVADGSAEKIDVFEQEGTSAPTVSALAAQNLSSGSALLSAQVDPDGADTHYYFQYGTASCVSDPGACSDVPAPPGTDLGAGFADQGASAELIGLKPSTTYYYRLVASNAHGQAEGTETFGSITTLPSAEGLLADGRAWEMVSPAEKDGSGIEPLRREGGLIQASEDGTAITYVANGPIVPEPEGNRAPYPTQALATRGGAGWSSRQIVTPRNKGEGFVPGEAPEYRAFSQDLSQGVVQPDNQDRETGEPLEQPPLAQGATEKTMYLRDSASGTFLPLVTPASDTAGTSFGGKLEFEGATPDLSHVVLSSQVPLLKGTAAGLYEWHAGSALEPVSILPDGSPALEPALGEEGHNVRGAVAAGGTRVVWTGESEVLNGETPETVRHLYMRNLPTGQTVQLDAAGQGVQEPGEEESEVGFQAANTEGTRIFFTDTARLTEDSNLAPIPGVPGNPADLYECEIIEEAGKLACKLHDLTVDHRTHEGADVLNLAAAVSEDGSYVYFVANGVLAPGAAPGHCVHLDQESPPPNATCNLYVWHNGTTSFIATLSDEDSGDWGSTEGPGRRGQFIEPRPDLANVTAGSSPDGRYFAFMSDRSLTGYENRDANPAAKGARDEEVYLYNAATKLTVCASCNPSGDRPRGVLDTQNAGEGLGLLVDRPEDWVLSASAAAPTAHWLAASLPGWTPLGNESAAEALRPPRYLSDSGRLFFDAADPLVKVEGAPTRPELVGGEPTQVGVENVYEYEPGGLGSCASERGCVALASSGSSEQESAFVDASVSGEDAFFVTARQLVAQDHDTNFDLYDARVCTSGSPCITSEGAASRPCESTSSCRIADPPPPPPGSAGTSAVSSGGNVPRHETRGYAGAGKPAPKALTRPQKLAKALKACRTRYARARKRRLGCEVQARRAYGARRSVHRKRVAR